MKREIEKFYVNEDSIMEWMISVTHLSSYKQTEKIEISNSKSVFHYVP